MKRLGVELLFANFANLSNIKYFECLGKGFSAACIYRVTRDSLWVVIFGMHMNDIKSLSMSVQNYRHCL